MEPSVPRSTLRAEPENLVEEILEDVEDIFAPKPGGIVDRHRQEKAKREAAAREAENTAERIEQRAFKAVKTADQSPEVFASSVVTVPAGGTAMVLPLSAYRYRALLSVVTATTPVTALVITTPAFPVAGVFAQNPNNFPVLVTFTNGVAFTIYGGGAGTAAIASNVSGPVSVVIFPGQAVGWNGGTTAPTAWVWTPAFGVTAPGSVVLARDSGAALSANGVTLAYGSLLETRARAQLWAYNSSSVPVQVGVLSEIYAPEL